MSLSFGVVQANACVAGITNEVEINEVKRTLHELVGRLTMFHNLW